MTGRIRAARPEPAAKAREANVDVVGVSILSGSHIPLCRRLREELQEKGLYDKLWIVGGNIPEEDRMVLRQLGFSGVFPTGLVVPGDSLLAEVTQDWLDEFERVQWLLRLSPRLRQKHGD